MDEGFAGLVRGPSTRLPRGYLYLIPIWLAAALAGLWYGWQQAGGTLPPWYGGLALAGLVLAATVLVSVLGTARHLAFRADGNGIRLGVRTARKRPRQRQAHLWWADVQQLVLIPRRYGLLLEVTLGPAARITRRRSLVRQALLMCCMVVLPLGLGRGTPRLTEPRTDAPQYRVRLVDLTPEELGIALAPLAPSDVEIIVMSRRRRPRLARRTQQAVRTAA
jgi:hypothetical protein